MRPLPGDDVYAARSRRGSSADNDMTPSAPRAHQPQMSYFLADETMMEAGQAQPSKAHIGSDVKHSIFGVQGMETSSMPHASLGDVKARNTLKKRMGQHIGGTRDTSPESTADSSEQSSPFHPRSASQAPISRPYTPLSLGSPAPASLLSSPRSRKGSDGGFDIDESPSQAIASSGEDEQSASMMDSESVPQLVMPSIRMPSRRPFTERGKAMGRLKILIAGGKGVGKTSLIKAIVQTCDDIVHVDPITTPSANFSELRKPSDTTVASLTLPTSQIAEVFASTRAYPAWWSDIEESRMSKRRKSLGDSVLERNLCFVDTPGYGTKAAFSESINSVAEYVESQLQRVLAMDGLRDSDLVNVIAGHGGSQVDVVFFIIKDRIQPSDIEYMRKLALFTNIIPLIAQSDVLTAEEVTNSKAGIISELQSSEIRPFLFGSSFDNGSTSAKAPYAISTLPSKNDETMEASLLMSPDYVCPLVPSELSTLVSQIFEQDTVSWLRYSAAKKLVQWRDANGHLFKSQGLHRPLSLSSSRALTSPIGTTPSLALAKMTEHTQRQERLAQIRLSKWAADLQRSLHNERSKFESVARSERAIWLTERLGECVQNGTLVPITQSRPASRVVVPSSIMYRSKQDEGELDATDPLGILAWHASMRRYVKTSVKILTGMGLVAGFMLLVSKTVTGRDIATELKAWRDEIYDSNALSWRCATS